MPQDFTFEDANGESLSFQEELTGACEELTTLYRARKLPLGDEEKLAEAIGDLATSYTGDCPDLTIYERMKGRLWDHLDTLYDTPL